MCFILKGNCSEQKGSSDRELVEHEYSGKGGERGAVGVMSVLLSFILVPLASSIFH